MVSTTFCHLTWLWVSLATSICSSSSLQSARLAWAHWRARLPSPSALELPSPIHSHEHRQFSHGYYSSAYLSSLPWGEITNKQTEKFCQRILVMERTSSKNSVSQEMQMPQRCIDSVVYLVVLLHNSPKLFFSWISKSGWVVRKQCCKCSLLDPGEQSALMTGKQSMEIPPANTWVSQGMNTKWKKLYLAFWTNYEVFNVPNETLY